MKRRLSPFRVFKRKINNRRVFYVRLIDTVTGEILKTVASGKTRRDEAVIWAKEYFEARENKQTNITLSEITFDFWDPDGDYSQRRKARGYSMSRKHLSTCESITRNYILPAWGRYPVGDLKSAVIDRWILDLHRKGALAPATINKILSTFRAILDLAVSGGHIRENPAAHVRPVRVTIKRRGILTNEEAKRLLSSPEYWKDFRHYAINLLAFSTGARLGEIQALLAEHVKPDRVEIVHSWEERVGLKNPKFDSFRVVPISAKVYAVLERIIRETRPVSLVFYSTPDRRDIPIGKKVIEQHLYNAIREAGISPEERRARNITFHSWRHKLNSVLRSQGVPDSKIRLLTGHRSGAMTDHYTRFTAEDFSDVVNTQNVFLDIYS